MTHIFQRGRYTTNQHFYVNNFPVLVPSLPLRWLGGSRQRAGGGAKFLQLGPSRWGSAGVGGWRYLGAAVPIRKTTSWLACYQLTFPFTIETHMKPAKSLLAGAVEHTNGIKAQAIFQGSWDIFAQDYMVLHPITLG